MRIFRRFLLLVAATLAMPVHAVEFWHSSTAWAGQGQCVAKFSFDSAMESIDNLQVLVIAIDAAGKEVANGSLAIEQFGYSNADRYADAYLEGDGVCEEKITIVVKKAAADIEGKRTDLLKTGKLKAREFKPFKIVLGE
jgi:hypothetical protein